MVDVHHAMKLRWGDKNGSMKPKKLRGWITAAITIGIFFYLFLSVELEKAWSILRASDPWLLLQAGGLSLLFPVLCAVRWHLIVLRLGTDMGLWNSFQIVMAAWPLGAATPAKSGDLIKLVFLKNTLPYSQTTGVILAERIVDVAALSVFAVVFGYVYQLHIGVWMGGGILCGVIAFFAAASSTLIQLAPQRFQSFTRDVLKASKEMARNGHAFFWILLATFANWFLSIYQTWLCYRAFHIDMPLAYVAAALPIAIFVGLLPITVSGMGTRDSAIRALFQSYASPEANLSVGILYSIFGHWMLAIFGIPFMKAAFQGKIGGIGGERLKKEVYQETN